MLCKKCLKISFTRQLYPRLWSWLHYHKFSDLDISAREGCELCMLFRTGVLRDYSHKNSCSVEKAESYHRKIDRTDEEERKDVLTFTTRPGFHVSVIIQSVDTAIESGLVKLVYARARRYIKSTPSNEIYVALQVSSLPDSIALRKWNILGRHVPASVNFAMAKDWIDCCILKHVKCAQRLEVPLPSRVLDLGSSGDTLDLRLLTNTDIHSQYATLSHCWGNSQPLKLTTATYESFQQMITFSSLPKTFQDAVIATRALGLRYLWIDSLCILQDSKQDWEEQCSMMVRVYKDSAVTIAGPQASDCHSGFLNSRPLNDEISLTVSDDEDSDRIAISIQDPADMEWMIRPELQSPLAKRAWVLQERLLSPRTIYFGSTRMFFECFTNNQDESCHFPAREGGGGFVKKVAVAQLKSKLECFQHWEILVRDYSSKSLTYMTDRLPALSALASDFHRATGADYLAGLWRQDLPVGLTWHIPQHHFENTSPMPSNSEYIAPSWSWASKSYKIGELNSIEDGKKREFDGDCEILEAEVKPAGLDPFGAVASGHLKISGRICSAVVQNENSNPYVSSLGSSSLNTRLASYSPDEGLMVRGSKLSVLLLYLGRFRNGNTVALSIKRAGHIPTTYVRVGLAHTTYLSSELKEMFENVERTTVTII